MRTVGPLDLCEERLHVVYFVDLHVEHATNMAEFASGCGEQLLDFDP